MSDAEQSAEYRVFISHRHLDKDIATAIRTNLVRWGLPESHIYQSSSEGSGPAAGGNIKRDIREHLAQSDLFLLVYTGRRQEWPLFELGIAAASNAHIVVFQISKTPPPMQQEERSIPITEEDVVSFAKSFHVLPGFFPSKPAFAPQVKPEVYRERGRQLYRDLVRATAPKRPWRLVLAMLTLLLCGSVAGALAHRSYAPEAFPQLASLQARAEVNGHRYFIESMSIFLRVEREHAGECVDAMNHQGCQLLRTVRGAKVHVVHTLSNSEQETTLWSDNPSSDWAIDSTVIPGNSTETLIGGSERRKEYRVSAGIPNNDAFTVITGYKFIFPFEKKTRLIMDGFTTGPFEANSEYTVPQHYVGELTIVLQSDSINLTPVTAYRVNSNGQVEKSDVVVRSGFDPATPKTLTKRWTNLEPGETVGVVYSWRGTVENQ